ncbi:MAG: hypothetical protein ABSA90_08415 [Xanthobacteraceae bacterium]|jgi:hypothetical protein
MNDTDKEAEEYWDNLLGFKVDPWLGISGSALKECYAALGVVSERWNASEGICVCLLVITYKYPKHFPRLPCATSTILPLSIYWRTARQLLKKTILISWKR